MWQIRSKSSSPFYPIPALRLQAAHHHLEVHQWWLVFSRLLSRCEETDPNGHTAEDVFPGVVNQAFSNEFPIFIDVLNPSWKNLNNNIADIIFSRLILNTVIIKGRRIASAVAGIIFFNTIVAGVLSSILFSPSSVPGSSTGSSEPRSMTTSGSSNKPDQQRVGYITEVHDAKVGLAIVF